MCWLKTFADECGKILFYLLQYVYSIYNSKWVCLLKLCVYQSGKGLLYFTDTILVDKVDNCTSSYNSFTNIEKGREWIDFSKQEDKNE